MFETFSRMTHTIPVPCFIAGSLLTMMVLILLSNPLDAAPGSKTEILPLQKAAPAAVAIETAGSEAELRRQMRAKNGVAELHTGTVRFSQAPTGSFGFIAPQFLGMALVTQSPDLALERVSPAANAYEIHKLADGSGLLVGFMGGDLVPQVTPSQRPKNIRIALYSNPSDKAPLIVAVPLVKLMVDRMPVRLDPKQPDSPVMLDMDLQGTANRKSPQMGQ
ncbi:MAG: hypothetical protein EWM72_03062 [Nitrospira sp.]|nr:MAG: hypothetical protein EWM72_03062 [Nitrospira sp.]